MDRIRVLVVDDSVVARKILSGALADQPDIEVIGTAPTGRVALAKIRQLHPDLITLDLDMPEMNGLETLDALRDFTPPPKVLMCSALTHKDGGPTLEALARGAADYITKPSALGEKIGPGGFQAELLAKVRALAGLPAVPGGGSAVLSARARGLARPDRQRIEVVAIGVSTGGPNALAALFSALPRNFPVPIVLVQHMPPGFTRSLADRLSAKGSIPVAEGADGTPLEAGRAWVAPGDFHMQVDKGENGPVIRLHQAAPENSCRPAVDVLFRSVAGVYGPRALAVVLTGMGQDGLRGCQQLASAGAEIYVQDEATSVVWGMPGQVAKAGLADLVLPLDQLAEAILQRAAGGRPWLRNP